MKKILFLIGVLSLIGCEQRISSVVESSPSGHVSIGGKDCSIVMVNAGDGMQRLYFIDCGPGSSSVNYQYGKNQHVTVGQYNPPVEAPDVDAGSSEAPACTCVTKTK